MFVRAAKEGVDEEMKGVKVDVRATWRDRVDWEDEEWGRKMLERVVGGGDAEGEGREERGVLLEVSFSRRVVFVFLDFFTAQRDAISSRIVPKSL